jgi:dihydromethanopterin reductase
MMDVRLIAAVGRRGQLGLGGRLPWHDPVDLRWFKENTMGGVVLFGGRTYRAVGDLPGRVKARWSGHSPPGAVLMQIAARYKGKVIWIAGGAYTYTAFMPFVRVAVISRIDYDGEADSFMPPIWGGSNANGDAHARASEPVTTESDRGPGPGPLLLPEPAPETVEAISDRSVVRKRHPTGWLSRNRRRWSRRTT